MGVGKLGPNGWEIPTRAKKTEGTVEKVNAANNQLVKENNMLRDQVDNLTDEVATLTAELEQATGTDMPTKIRVALELLDPKNNEHWTEMGLPKVEAVCVLVEDNEITRADIEAALPGFTRQKEPA